MLILISKPRTTLKHFFQDGNGRMRSPSPTPSFVHASCTVRFKESLSLQALQSINSPMSPRGGLSAILFFEDTLSIQVNTWDVDCYMANCSTNLSTTQLSDLALSIDNLVPSLSKKLRTYDFLKTVSKGELQIRQPKSLPQRLFVFLRCWVNQDTTYTADPLTSVSFVAGIQKDSHIASIARR